MANTEGKALAERILDVIEPLITRGEVAGSIRRRKADVKDVDLVVIPRPLTWPAMVANKISGLGGSVIKAGPKLLQMDVLGNQVDLYASNSESWGMHLLRWTGSKEHNIWLCIKAQLMGMKLAVSRGLMNNGEMVASRTEMEIFEALGLSWIPPEERER